MICLCVQYDQLNATFVTGSSLHAFTITFHVTTTIEFTSSRTRTRRSDTEHSKEELKWLCQELPQQVDANALRNNEQHVRQLARDGSPRQTSRWIASVRRCVISNQRHQDLVYQRRLQ